MGANWPGELTGPPDGLHRQPLPLVEVGPLFFRCHRRSRGAVHFGRRRAGRFGDPNGLFGVLYVGLDPRATFIEVLGDNVTIDPAELAARVISGLVADRPARLVDLTGGHLPRIGLDARVATGSHEVSRRWSSGFHDHPERPDGLLYRCRHDPSQFAVALFERAELTFEVTPLGESVLAALATSSGLAVE